MLFSQDNGMSWDVIAFEIDTTEFSWDVSTYPVGQHGKIKIIASDGLNIGEDINDNPFTILQSLFLPIVQK